MRGLEILVGLLVAATGIGSLLLGVIVVRSIAANEIGYDDKTWRLLLLVLSVPIVAWCSQVAWRLLTGRGRFGTDGLLSPTTYVLVGVGCLTAIVATLVSSPTGGARVIGVLLTIATLSFGFASTQRRAERKARHK